MPTTWPKNGSQPWGASIGADPFQRAQQSLIDELVRERDQAQKDVHTLRSALELLIQLVAPDFYRAQRQQDPGFFARLTSEAWLQLAENLMRERAAVPAESWPHQQEIQRLQAEIQTLQQTLQDALREIAALRREQDILWERATQTSVELGEEVPEPEADMTGVDSAINVAELPLSGRLELPRLPTQLPARFAKHMPSNWERPALLLLIMARTGWSLKRAILHELSLLSGMSANSGAAGRMVSRLEEGGLIRRQTVPTTDSKAVLIHLTELGRELVQHLGIDPVETEWDRLMRAHGGSAQEKHAALVILAAHYARRHGYRTLVCPPSPADGVLPDLLLAGPDGKIIYTEVEAESGDEERRLKKWRNLADVQGKVAIVAPTPGIRERLVREAKQAARRGVATDLDTLRQEELKRISPLPSFWLEEW